MIRRVILLAAVLVLGAALNLATVPGVGPQTVVGDLGDDHDTTLSKSKDAQRAECPTDTRKTDDTTKDDKASQTMETDDTTDTTKTECPTTDGTTKTDDTTKVDSASQTTTDCPTETRKVEPKPTPPPEPEVGETKVEKTLDLTADVKTVEGKRVVETTSDDEKVTVTIPVAAAVETMTIAVTVNVVVDTDVYTTVPSGTFVVAGETLDVQVKNDKGVQITEFAEPITVTAKVDPVNVDVETVAVFFFDRTIDVWVQIPATVSADGTVTWSADHLTLFSLLRLSKVTVQLNNGLNLITFTGASGTTPADVVTTLGGSSVIQNLLRFEPSTQSFATFIPNAASIVNTLKSLSQRDALFVNVDSPSPVLYTSTDIVVSEDGKRTVTVVPGLNAISFTGTNETDVAAFLTPLGSSVISASRFKSATQSWDTFAPGAPSFANTLKTLSRLDVIFVNVSGATQFFEIVEVPQ